MSSGELIPSPDDHPEPASSEVHFALVIARMIDSVSNSPDQLRQAVYELARHKLQEQFTDTNAQDIRRTRQALEIAIRGVEEHSKQPALLAAPPPPESISEVGTRPHLQIDPEPNPAAAKWMPPPWQPLKRALPILAVAFAILLAVVQRERLALLIQQTPTLEAPTAPPPAPMANALVPPTPLPAKPAPLRPTDYGVYAVIDDRLTALQLLPGRAPDIRVAVSAAVKTPSQTVLPSGHPKFIVYHRDATSNIADRAYVRIMAKVAREFSAKVAGKKPGDGDDIWIIRNVAFPFRSSPVMDNPEMYELHSEDPALELTPGRYALVLNNQSYDFTVEGKALDPRQCIERIVSLNGTFYTDCKVP